LALDGLLFLDFAQIILFALHITMLSKKMQNLNAEHGSNNLQEDHVDNTASRSCS